MLLTTLRHFESFGKILQFLKDILRLHLSAEMLGRENLTELLLEIMPDNKHHLTEARTHCVIYRIIYDSLIVGADSVHLLQ